MYYTLEDGVKQDYYVSVNKQFLTSHKCVFSMFELEWIIL